MTPSPRSIAPRQAGRRRARLAQRTPALRRGCGSLFEQDRFRRRGAAPDRGPRLNWRTRGSPFDVLAALDSGAVAYVEATTPARDASRAACRRQWRNGANYLYAAGARVWFRGLVAFAQGRLGDAQARYEDTLATFERMGDVEQAVGAHNLLAASVFCARRQDRRVASSPTRVSRRLSISRSPRFRYSMLASAAISVRVENPETALAMQDSACSQARRQSGRDAADRRCARAARVRRCCRSGGRRSGEQTLQKRASICTRHADASFRRILELPVLAAESDLLRATQTRARRPRPRSAQSTRVVARGDRSRLPQFQLRLAKANIVVGPPGRGRACAGRRAFRRLTNSARR